MLKCYLSRKLKNDAGNITANLSDASGSLANFFVEFIDVTSINVTANSTTAVIPVYDYKDSVISGTYSISAGVVTVNASNHGLIVGQKVKLNYTTGTGVPEAVIVTEVVNANSFKANTTLANTSGNLSIYSQGLRIYLFDKDGNRVSGKASWSVRGY